jgi:hypothetical protein
VVSTLESSPVREAEFFISELHERKLHLGAIVLNKVLPKYLLDLEATDVAHRLCSSAAKIAPLLPVKADTAQVERVLREIGESFLNFQVVAKREAEIRSELAEVPDVVAAVPYFDSDIYDLEGLIRLGDKIWR